MKYNIDRREYYTVFTLEEEKLNSLIAPNLKTELILLVNRGDNKVVLNMENVTFIDSSGLSSILVANRQTKEQGGVLILNNVDENVMRLIKISQLDAVLNIMQDKQEARDFIMKIALEEELNKSETASSEEE